MSRERRGALHPDAVLRVAPLLVGVALLASTTPAHLTAQETAHWYIGTYTHDLLVWDEASEEIVDVIEMRHPIPAQFTVGLNQDRLYVREASGQIIEVVDVEAGEVVDEIRLSDADTRVRITGFAPHPSNRTAVMEVVAYTKHLDRYSVDGPFIVEYDLETDQVTDTIRHPDDTYESDNSGYRIPFRFSPDGETLYFFASDIIAVDSESYEEVDRWGMSEPLEPGLGRSRFGTGATTYDADGVATGLFRMTDPAQNRRMMGVARTHLAEREVDFFTLGPSQPLESFTLAPGGEKAYALYSEIGHYEFWEFDLVSELVTRRQPFPGRPRMGLQVSADGERLYVHIAGNTIDVYDAASFELLRTVELEHDMTGVAIIPVG